MKEIRMSQHAHSKLEVLESRGLAISLELVIGTVSSPDRLELGQEGRLIAQGPLDENLVLRVVYREFNALIVVITLYPGKRARYEKD
ncbi:MAG: hypothetical protein WBB01_15865 [Phormidesmis sp.]